MNGLRDLVITKIDAVVDVFSPKGRSVKIKDRKSYGISFCREGQITYTHNGKNLVSDKNSAIILPKGGTYTLHGDKTGTFPVINFDCENFNCDTLTVIPINNGTSFINDFEYMKRLFTFEVNHLKLMSVFYNMIDRLNFCGEDILKPAIAYLEDNIENPDITNKLLAQKARISEVYFRQLFTKKYGITPKQYIINMRIQKAKQLLTDGNKKVSSVAEECGFSSVYHFCRCFKERAGMTPIEYTKQNRIFGI